MNKEQLEKFNEKFDVYKAPNWWLPNLDDKKMYTLITEYNKSIKQFISDILKAQRQEIIKKLDQLSLCMGNEWLEGERYYAVQTLIKTLINKQR